MNSSILEISDRCFRVLSIACENLANYSESAIRVESGQKKVLEALNAQVPDEVQTLKSFLEPLKQRKIPFKLIRNLPVSSPESLLIAVGYLLGKAVDPLNSGWSKVVREISPKTDAKQAGQFLNESLHTDGTTWEHPNDFTILFCLRNDQNGGGESLLLPLEKIIFEARSKDFDLGDFSKNFNWRDELSDRPHSSPIFCGQKESIRWLRESLLPRDEGEVQLFAKLEQFLSSITPISILLEPGDILFLDNNSCLHSRAPVSAPKKSDRLLLRIKVHRHEC